MMEYELYHHGILGMHWGIRRYQNKDGTLTEAGKKRYGFGDGNNQNNNDVQVVKSKSSAINKADKRVKKAENAYKVASAKYESNPNSKNRLSMNLATKELDWAKQDRSDERIKQKLKQESAKKSQHRLKLEAKYREKGMTQEEAEIAAYKRVRTEKILAATAAVAVTAAVAYVGTKHYNEFIDQTIKSGTRLQNISIDSNKGVEDAFYAAYKKGDMIKYRGLYGTQLKTTYAGHDVYKTTIQATSNIRVASNNNARKVLSDMVTTDSNFAANLKTHLSKYSSDPVTRKALRSLNKGIVDKNVFEATNHYLVDHSKVGESVSSAFYKKLKDAGYDAILDTNDMKYSGYGAKKPVIVFNSLGKASSVLSEKLSDDKIANDMRRGYAMIIGREILKSTAAQVGVMGGVAAASTAAIKAREDKMVQKYRQDHPNTKLSYTEMLRMLERKRIRDEH